MHKLIPVEKAVGTVLAHDITEIMPGEFKGRAFKKGHIVTEDDIAHLKRLGKENLYVLKIFPDEMHENDAAKAIAKAIAGAGTKLSGEPVEGKINILALHDGLLKVKKEALIEFNMLAEVMCATIHNNTVVKEGECIAGTRAIPLVIKKFIAEQAVSIAKNSYGLVEVFPMRKPDTGVIITGNEVFSGMIKDAFSPIIKKKIESFNGKILKTFFAPDTVKIIKGHIMELAETGADLIILTGGMSVDPDDVTRLAILEAGAKEIIYGSSVLPGAMFLIAYMKNITIMGMPACGIHHKITILDLILPRILAGEKIKRSDIAELGHGGMCLNCEECRYPVCPFGKGA